MASQTQAQRRSWWSEAKDLGKRFGKEFSDDDLTGLAAEVAYHLMFAIPPLLVLMVTGAALLNVFTDVPVVDNLQRIVNENAPEDLQSVLNPLIDNAVGQVSGGLASLGAIITAVLALWSGSNGVASLMKAFNRTYDVREGRSFIKKRAVAIGLTLLLIVLINLAFALFVFGGSIGQWVASQAGLGGAFATVWNLARWPLAVIAIMFLLAVLYYLGPNIEQSFNWISPGSVVATILWFVAAFGFRIYLNFSDPGSAYGIFGSLIVFLLFLYITGLVFLIGAEINAVLQKRYDEAVVRDRVEHPERLETREDYEDALREATGRGQAAGLTASDVHEPVSSPEPRSTEPGQVRQEPARGPDQQRSADSLVRGVVAGGLAAALGSLFGRRRSRP